MAGMRALAEDAGTRFDLRYVPPDRLDYAHGRVSKRQVVGLSERRSRTSSANRVDLGAGADLGQPVPHENLARAGRRRIERFDPNPTCRLKDDSVSGGHAGVTVDGVGGRGRGRDFVGVTGALVSPAWTGVHPSDRRYGHR